MGESHVQPQRAEPVRINESDLLGDPAYGDTVTTTVSASNTSPAACRTWAAIIYSTEVADVDQDGLPDGLEDAPGGLKDPDGDAATRSQWDGREIQESE